MIYVLLWVLLAAFVGYLGRHRAAGFMGCFLASLLFTPLTVVIVLILSKPAPQVH
jgi:uncharacterized membrane protein